MCSSNSQQRTSVRVTNAPDTSGPAATSQVGALSIHQVLQDTAHAIRDEEVPWYELLAVRDDAAVRCKSGEAVTVESVIAENAAAWGAVAGTHLAPVLTMAGALIEGARAAASVHEEVLEAIACCVAISRCVVGAGERSNFQESTREILGSLQDEMETVIRITQRFSPPTSRRGKLDRSAGDQQKLNRLRQKLREKLKLILENDMVAASNPAVLPADTRDEFRGLGGAPEPSGAYVRRAVDDAVVEHLVDPRRPAPSCHCVWGAAGAGKSLLASSVSRDERTLSSFKHGIFWITVGDAGTGNKLVMLLERLAMLFERASPTGNGTSRPAHRFRAPDDAIGHLRRARGHRRCMVVLDDVRNEDVVKCFASTGFHLLVTARRRTVVPRKWWGTFTEVGDMADGEALELLRLASQAAGPLPKHEATSVADTCGRLPLALGMAGRLGQQEDPLSPSRWRDALETLRDKVAMFRRKEVDNDGGTLFPVVAAAFDRLSERQRKRAGLMVVVTPMVPFSTKMMASLWNSTAEDTRTDADALVESSLLHEESGASYVLHDLIHDYLRLHTKTSPEILSRVISRQALFLTSPETLRTYMNNDDDTFGGPYSLVRLWATIRKMDPSRKAWEQVMKVDEEASTDEVYMRDAGSLLLLLGEFDGAEELWTKVLLKEVEEEGKNDYSMCTPSALSYVGRSLEGQGKYVEAKSLYVCAIAIAEMALGTDRPSCSTYLSNLEGLLEEQGKYGEAEPLQRRPRAITGTGTMGTRHPSFPIFLNDLAGLLQKKGKYDEAEVLCRRAVAATEATLGTEHPSYPTSLNNLAGLVASQGKYDEAVTLFRRAMSITEATLGTDHPLYSMSLNSLARLLYEQGNYDEAEFLLQRAVAIAETIIETDHPSSSIRLSSLAKLFQEQGKFEEAKPLYRRAMVITEKTLGAEHPSYSVDLRSLANLLQWQGEHEEAEVLYRRAMAITKATLGTDHLSFSTDLNNLAVLRQKQGKYHEAELLFRRAMAVTEAKLGTNHPSYSTDLNNLAGLLEDQGKYDEAESLYLRSIAITERTLGTYHPSRAIRISNLAGLLQKQGNYDEAETLFRDAMAIAEIALGTQHPSYPIYLNNLAGHMEKQGKHDEAEPLYRRAIEIAEAVLGKNHPLYPVLQGNLAGLLKKRGNPTEWDDLHRRAQNKTFSGLDLADPKTGIKSDTRTSSVEKKTIAHS